MGMSNHQSPHTLSNQVQRALDRLLKIDPYLKPYTKIIARRLSAIETMEKRLTGGTIELADFASIQRGLAEILADDFVCFRICVPIVTDDPVFQRLFGAKGKWHRIFISLLGCESCPVDGIFMEPHRGFCF